MKQSVALITGCSSGFGLRLIEPLARAGHTVFATMRDPRGRNAAAAAQLEALATQHGLDVHVRDLDVTSSTSVDAAVAAILDQTQRIDVVVNNAAIMPVGITEAFTVAQLQATLEANVVGVFRVNQAVLPAMRAQQTGLLIQISSQNGRVPLPFFGVYCASKFAVEALAETLRYELSPFGVDSCIVQPGPFPTELMANSPAPLDADRLAAYGPMAAARDAIRDDAKTRFASLDCNLVVEAVLGLIATPAGERPLRTTVGVDFGAKAINEATTPVIKGTLEALGFGHLEHVAAAGARR